LGLENIFSFVLLGQPVNAAQSLQKSNLFDFTKKFELRSNADSTHLLFIFDFILPPLSADRGRSRQPLLTACSAGLGHIGASSSTCIVGAASTCLEDTAYSCPAAPRTLPLSAPAPIASTPSLRPRLDQVCPDLFSAFLAFWKF
jgi:hypothetical protein